MYAPDDTIVAVATPAGRGGIGVVRISGPAAAKAAGAVLRTRRALRPRHATLTSIVGASAAGRALDRVVATFFPRPNSYTGEDVVEISAHGSPLLLRQILEALMATGARLAEPGEFTLRAFVNGRMDLVQAEAVADLIDAVTPLQARVAFDQLEGTLTAVIGALDAALFDLIARLEASIDFPDEGYHFANADTVAAETRGLVERSQALLASARRGRLVREGRQVVILGKPNVGKSTLFNHLLGASRAIVTSTPGTTRDLLTETAEIGGMPVTLVDTAGIRQAADAVEAEGVARARGALEVAAAVLLVLDRSRPLETDDHVLLRDTAGADRLLVVNKTDLPQCWDAAELPAASRRVTVSLQQEQGSAALRAGLADLLGAGETLRDTPALSNLRHITLVERAAEALERAADAAAREAPEELILADLQDARAALEEVTGKRTADDVLQRIFSRFCIGK